MDREFTPREKGMLLVLAVLLGARRRLDRSGEEGVL